MRAEIAVREPAFAPSVSLAWLTVSDPGDKPAVDTLRQQHTALGLGEAEAIVVALRQQARLLIDERLGARLANAWGITNTGVLGVLIAAKSMGLISAVGPLLDDLVASGFYVTPRVIASVLRRVDEEP